MNPLNLRGPEFLALYVCVLGATAALAALLRWLLRLPTPEPGEEVPELTAYEAAYLAGGPQLALHAAIASLVHRRVLSVQPAERKLSVQGPVPSKADPLEQRIYHSAGKAGETISQVCTDASATVNQLGRRLQEAGLVPSDQQGIVARLFPGFLMGLVSILGLAKIVVGLERGRPVGFLIGLTIISAVIAIVFLIKRPLRSRHGDAALARLRDQNAALRSVARSEPERLAQDDLVLALGLFGLGIFATGPVADLRTALRPPPGAGSSGCGGGGCGGGGCGGGCGGGGCGGCGS
jgi:uncharacterized protein (TIGR04222 family)